ncbi:acyl-CoA thioesterase [Seongchinamella sediminis]|uniref:Acyl-CoA thioesterase n=1 Tax=Seongchinamella sediminis TaxID=2283635 RepID=A0A3L7DV56_9GAMM|nr:thioesterase family protein [Seongchinamella sediminis]RLQ21457.1 acyl-CoA thioesterase [Seongchinamella sediminis]
MFTVIQRLRVEWSHCDPAGIIFNPNYYIWMDGGTHGLLQAAGFDFVARTRDSSDFLGCPLVASNMEFKRPLRLGDIVTLVSRVEKFGTSSFVVTHEFSSGSACDLVARGAEVRVWAHSGKEGGSAIVALPVPEAVRKLLSVEKTVDISV